MVLDEWMKEQMEQEQKDKNLLYDITKFTDDTYFKDIEFELEESENTVNYKIVDEPVGLRQNEGNYNIWVNQSCGETGDDYSGTVCMKLPNGKYLMWDYWM